MPIIGSVTRVYGRDVEPPAVVGSGLSVSSVLLDFEARVSDGAAQWEIADVSGVLMDVYALPDGSVAPDTGWAVAITDEAGNDVHSIASIDDADPTHDEGLAVPVSGTLTVTATGLGTTTLGRAKLKLVFADNVTVVNAGELADGDYGDIVVSGGGATLTVDDDAVATLTLTESPGTDATGTGIILPFTYGESLVPGDPVYFKSDGKAWKADANGSGTYPCVGIALETGSSGTRKVLLHGIMRLDSWNWTVGGLIYLSTSGTLTQTQPSTTGDVIQIIGVATHADRMYVNPQLDYLTHA